jgi:hypothetical protein
VSEKKVEMEVVEVNPAERETQLKSYHVQGDRSCNVRGVRNRPENKMLMWICERDVKGSFPMWDWTIYTPAMLEADNREFGTVLEYPYEIDGENGKIWIKSHWLVSQPIEKWQADQDSKRRIEDARKGTLPELSPGAVVHGSVRVKKGVGNTREIYRGER